MLSATRAYEQHIAEEGGRAILDMWARLGLTVEVDPWDGRFALWVDEPRRWFQTVRDACCAR